jgi:hypothetical protein
MLARLHGWNKIVFLDDNITISRPGNIARLAAQRDRHQVAGRLFASIPTILVCARLVETTACSKTSS